MDGAETSVIYSTYTVTVSVWHTLTMNVGPELSMPGDEQSALVELGVPGLTMFVKADTETSKGMASSTQKHVHSDVMQSLDLCRSWLQ